MKVRLIMKCPAELCHTQTFYFANVHGFTRPPTWIPWISFLFIPFLDFRDESCSIIWHYMKSLFFKDIKIGCKIYFFVRGVSFLFINSQAFRQNLNNEKSHKLIYTIIFMGRKRTLFSTWSPNSCLKLFLNRAETPCINSF